MTLPDSHQDAVILEQITLTKLITDNAINLTEIARIYVGTESAIDNSKISSFFSFFNGTKIWRKFTFRM